MPAIGLLTLSIHIEYAQSLKDKRQVLRSLKDRLRRGFNVSVAEVDFQDTWQRALVAVAAVSNNRSGVESLLDRVEREAERLLGGNLTSADVEFL